MAFRGENAKSLMRLLLIVYLEAVSTERNFYYSASGKNLCKRGVDLQTRESVDTDNPVYSYVHFACISTLWYWRLACFGCSAQHASLLPLVLSNWFYCTLYMGNTPEIRHTHALDSAHSHLSGMSTPDMPLPPSAGALQRTCSSTWTIHPRYQAHIPLTAHVFPCLTCLLTYLLPQVLSSEGVLVHGQYTREIRGSRQRPRIPTIRDVV